MNRQLLAIVLAYSFSLVQTTSAITITEVTESNVGTQTEPTVKETSTAAYGTKVETTTQTRTPVTLIKQEPTSISSTTKETQTLLLPQREITTTTVSTPIATQTSPIMVTTEIQTDQTIPIEKRFENLITEIKIAISNNTENLQKILINKNQEIKNTTQQVEKEKTQLKEASTQTILATQESNKEIESHIALVETAAAQQKKALEDILTQESLAPKSFIRKATEKVVSKIVPETVKQKIAEIKTTSQQASERSQARRKAEAEEKIKQSEEKLAKQKEALKQFQQK